MRELRRTAVVAACAASAVVALETLRWLHPIGHLLARESAPYVRMDRDGSVALETSLTRKVRGVAAGSWSIVVDRVLFDRSGRFLRKVTPNPTGEPAPPPAVRERAGSSRTNPWVRTARFDFRFDDESATGSTVRGLDLAEGWHDGYSHMDAGTKVRLGRLWPNGLGSPHAWSFEGGRFVCRDLKSGDLLAGFGPDGWVAGPGGSAGERFPADVVSPTGAHGYLYYPGAANPSVLVDSAGRRAIFLSIAAPTVAAVGARPNRGPVRVDVTAVSVAGPAGEPPRLAIAPEAGWSWRFGVSNNAELAIPLRVGPELVVVQKSGVTHRIRLGDDERDLVLTGDASCIATTLAPVGAPVARLRIRRLLDGGKVVSEDVDAIPVTTWGRVAALLDGVPSLLRPPLLNAASFVGPRVSDYDDFYSRWVTDGIVAGGDGATWFVGSLGVGALCAWLVRRQALRRVPDHAALWTALGAALGPLAFFCMRTAMPRSHVAACACGRRRAVHVATCPSCAASWPAPERTGIEVFA